MIVLHFQVYQQRLDRKAKPDLSLINYFSSRLLLTSSDIVGTTCFDQLTNQVQFYSSNFTFTISKTYNLWKEGSKRLLLIYLIIKMRQSSPGRYKGKGIISSESYNSLKTSSRGQGQRSYCHYNNAIYQGGFSSFKKHGKGLLFHDDGAAVVTDYVHDTPTGHNIIFRDNSITSLLFKGRSDYQIAYKASKCIFKIPFSGDSTEAHGAGVLIDYESQKIYELIFKKGVLVNKILHLDKRNNDEVFKRNSIARIVGLKHEQAFDLTFEKPDRMHVKLSNNRLTIGYYDQNGEIHGLAFKMYAENLQVNGTKPLYLKAIERGYYRTSKLNTFGQKIFSNSNKYVGQFENDQFDGYGIFISPQEMKWVYGKFVKGKMTQVLDSNNKRYTENNFNMWKGALLNIHSKINWKRYIDIDIYLPDQLYTYNLFKKSWGIKATQVDPDYQQALKEDQFRLDRIQKQFQEGYPSSTDKSYLDMELDKHYTVKSHKQGQYFSKLPKQTTPKHSNTPDLHASFNQGLSDSRERTPIRKVEEYEPQIIKRTNSIEQLRQQADFRMKDPFQFQLHEIQMQEPIRRTTKLKQEPTRRYQEQIREQIYPQKIQIHRQEKPLYHRRDYDDYYYYPRRYNQPIDGLYRHSYFDDLQRQKERIRLLERQNDDYVRSLRRGIQSSPVVRKYMNTPPRYDGLYNRYNGKILYKKRPFNYEQPTDYNGTPEKYNSYRPRQDREYYRRFSPQYDSPSRPTNTSPYRSSPRNNDRLLDRSSFVENNYKTWRK